MFGEGKQWVNVMCVSQTVHAIAFQRVLQAQCPRSQVGSFRGKLSCVLGQQSGGDFNSGQQAGSSGRSAVLQPCPQLSTVTHSFLARKKTLHTFIHAVGLTVKVASHCPSPMPRSHSCSFLLPDFVFVVHLCNWNSPNQMLHTIALAQDPGPLC